MVNYFKSIFLVDMLRIKKYRRSNYFVPLITLYLPIKKKKEKKEEVWKNGSMGKLYCFPQIILHE